MSKKHFEALAAALKAQRPDSDNCFQENRAAFLMQWQADTKATADVCARFNPNFDRKRFLQACGVEV